MKREANERVLGIIGGSGLYALDELSDVRELRIETPYGPPSDVLIEGRLGATRLVFLPRHGRGHRLPPHAIDYRANICAMKLAGATHLLSVSAVGSMKEAILPGDLVVVDQFIDLTKRRASTFFDERGLVAHVGFADPVCGDLAGAVADAAERALAAEPGPADPSKRSSVHRGGTYLCMEGPQFSTRAESKLYRSWGVSVIGMTAMPEAKLAREAELPYATLALATDYDCWHETEEDVTVDAILAVMHSNVEKARRTVKALAETLPDPAKSRATGALRGAILTRDPTGPSATRLGWLLNGSLSE